MTSTKKKRARAVSKKTGVSHQEAHNLLNKGKPQKTSVSVLEVPLDTWREIEKVRCRNIYGKDKPAITLGEERAGERDALSQVLCAVGRCDLGVGMIFDAVWQTSSDPEVVALAEQMGEGELLYQCFENRHGDEDLLLRGIRRSYGSNGDHRYRELRSSKFRLTSLDVSRDILKDPHMVESLRAASAAVSKSNLRQMPEYEYQPPGRATKEPSAVPDKYYKRPSYGLEDFILAPISERPLWSPYFNRPDPVVGRVKPTALISMVRQGLEIKALAEEHARDDLKMESPRGGCDCKESCLCTNPGQNWALRQEEARATLNRPLQVIFYGDIIEGLVETCYAVQTTASRPPEGSDLLRQRKRPDWFVELWKA